MKIQSFTINEFGILTKQNVQLSSGLSIFLGNNEAGKSTCLEFFRTMLTGFPSPRSKRAREGVFAQKNQKMGGILDLETHFAGDLKVSRTTQGLQVFQADGNLLPNTVMDTLLSGINREIYSSIYGFSLNELQALDTLESDEVKNALYGTFYGLGLFSPQKALNNIEDILSGKSSKIKSDSIKNLFKKTCTELEEIEEKIAELIKENENFDALFLQAEAFQESISQIKEEKNQSQAQLFQLETKIHAWEQWQEWYVINQEIERIPPISDFFPKDAQKRFEALLEQKNSKKQQIHELNTKVLALNEEIDNKAVQEDFNQNIPLIQELVEQKAYFRNALHSIPNMQNSIDRTNQELKNQLAQLGSDWNMEKIHSIDCSVFVYSALDEHSQQIQQKQNKLQQALNATQHLNQEKQLLEEDIALQKYQLENIQAPLISIDMPTRELLRISLQRVQDAEIKLPEKKRSLALANAEYQRSLAHIKFKSTLSQEGLIKLADSQEVSLNLANAILHQTQKAQEAMGNYIDAKKAVEQKEEQLQIIEEQRKKNTPPKRQTLQNKKQAFRRLSTLNSKKVQEEEKLLELQENYDEIFSTLPSTTSSILLVLVGFLFTFVSAISLIAYYSFRIQAVDISFISDLYFVQNTLPFLQNLPKVIPISSVISFGFFLIGFVCIYQNLPTTSPDRKKKIKTLQQITARKDSCLRKLKAMEAEINNHCQVLEISPQYLNYIDELELSLDNEHEQLITDEKLKDDTYYLEKELAVKRGLLAEALQNQQKEDKAIQELRRQWQEHFRELQVFDIPSPEGASAYFARIDHIRLTKQNLIHLEEEIADLELSKQNLKLLATEHLDYFESDANTLVVWVMHTLESCREADKQAEKKTLLQDNICQMEQKKANIEKTLEIKEKEYAQSKQEHEIALSNWQIFLEKLNIGSQLSPDTARTALSFIERCSTTETELIKLEEQLSNLKQDMEKLIQPLSSLFTTLKIKPISLPYSTEVDWLSSLDTLQEKAEKTKNELNEKQSLLSQVKEAERQLKQLELDFADLEAQIYGIMKESNAENQEDFFQKAEYLEELRSLQKRKQYVEDTLKFAAKDQDLTEFLKEFENLELPVLKYQKELLEEKVQEILVEEEKIMAEILKTQAQLNLLENSTTLSDLRQQKSILEEENNKNLTLCLTYSTAHRLIQNAKQKYEKEKQPELLKKASEIFFHITEGKWKNITTTFEDNILYINPYRGEPVTPDKLSQGTKEQLYLSIRLAYIQNAATYKEPLPIIMDDILVNFDTTRSTQTAKTLAQFTPDHQILFFTCHPHIATILKENVPTSSLYTINNGVITQKN